MYDPRIGRFLSPDPLLEMFPEQTPHHYAFNSPLIWKDPSGLKSEKEGRDKILTMTDVLKACGDIGEFVANLLGIGTEDWAVAPGWPPKKIKDEGGISGESGGKSKFQSPNSTSSTPSDLTTSGVPNDSKQLCDPMRTGGGSGIGLDNHKQAIGNIVANWSSLSANQALAVRNALQIIYDNGGKEVIDDLISTGHTFNIDFSFSSIDMKKHWNNHCKNIDFPIVGMSSFHWNDDCYSINPETSCDNPHFNDGNIYLANDLLINGKSILGNQYQSYKTWFWGILITSIQQKQKQLWMILAHEIKHYYDAKNCHGPLDKEGSANRFMIDIWNRINKPRLYNEGENF